MTELPEELRKAEGYAADIGEDATEPVLVIPSSVVASEWDKREKEHASFLEKARKELKRELFGVVGMLDSEVDTRDYREALVGVKAVFLKRIDAVFGGGEGK